MHTVSLSAPQGKHTILISPVHKHRTSHFKLLFKTLILDAVPIFKMRFVKRRGVGGGGGGREGEVGHLPFRAVDSGFEFWGVLP